MALGVQGGPARVAGSRGAKQGRGAAGRASICGSGREGTETVQRVGSPKCRLLAQLPTSTPWEPAAGLPPLPLLLGSPSPLMRMLYFSW